MINFIFKAYPISISVKDIVRYGNPGNYIYDIDAIGIRLNDFNSYMRDANSDITLWINPVEQSVTVLQTGKDLKSEEYCDEIEDLRISAEAISLLLDYEAQLIA